MCLQSPGRRATLRGSMEKPEKKEEKEETPEEKEKREKLKAEEVNFDDCIFNH